MITPRHTPTNDSRLTQASKALHETLAAALTRGFHGTVGIEVAVQDGTIQHIRRRTERIDK